MVAERWWLAGKMAEQWYKMAEQWYKMAVWWYKMAMSERVQLGTPFVGSSAFLIDSVTLLFHVAVTRSHPQFASEFP